jgi:hypothetical protein
LQAEANFSPLAILFQKKSSRRKTPEKSKPEDDRLSAIYSTFNNSKEIEKRYRGVKEPRENESVTERTHCVSG